MKKVCLLLLAMGSPAMSKTYVCQKMDSFTRADYKVTLVELEVQGEVLSYLQVRDDLNGRTDQGVAKVHFYHGPHHRDRVSKHYTLSEHQLTLEGEDRVPYFKSNQRLARMVPCSVD